MDNAHIAQVAFQRTNGVTLGAIYFEATEAGNLHYYVTDASGTNREYLAVIRATGVANFPQQLQEQGHRVYSAVNPPPIPNSAASTAVAAGSSVTTADTIIASFTFTATKTFIFVAGMISLTSNGDWYTYVAVGGVASSTEVRANGNDSATPIGSFTGLTVGATYTAQLHARTASVNTSTAASTYLTVY
jgi:hypothetical protein